jgi:hypothetical protein
VSLAVIIRIMTMMNIKKTLTTILLLTSIFCSVNGQTYISGGIYSNTTWTLANSPYIVTDTIVVFPNVTLTIQPGVVVKLRKNVIIEIRQAQLIAIGTSTDSITFTSDSIAPYQGIYEGIWLNKTISQGSRFKYCNFSYAYNAILVDRNSYATDSTIIFHCKFDSNHFGIYYHLGYNIFVDHCVFSNNQIALSAYSGGACSISVNNSRIINNQYGFYPMFNSILENSIIEYNTLYGIVPQQYDSIHFSYNGTGIWTYYDSYSQINNNIIENNTVGFLIQSNEAGGDYIFCNTICNNTQYNLKYALSFNSNLHIPNNYWCSIDSSTITNGIYDGYDNINLGLVYFTPFLTEPCSLITAVPYNANIFSPFIIFPNPASNYLTVKLTTNFTTSEIKIFNILGESEYNSLTKNQMTDIDISALTNGIHFIQVESLGNVSRQKFIKLYNNR